ncbi:MAG: glycosyltransferase family 4 protein [Planctomycetota bacterium]
MSGPHASTPCVLFVGNYLHGAGRPQISAEIAARLSTGGLAVRTVSPLRWPPARLLHMAGSVWWRRGTLGAVCIDVFSSAAFRFAELCSRLAHRRCPIVLVLHGGNLPELAQRQPARLKRTLERADVVVSPSSWLRDQLQHLRADIRVIGNPLDVARYAAPDRPLPPAPHMLWLRAFHAIYQPDMAVRVLHALSATHPTARLTMIGPDKGDGSRQRVLDVASKLCVTQRMTLHDAIPRDEVPATLAAHHGVFINTTSVDNTPVSVLEAMSSRLPVVSTDVGGVPHIAPHEQRALLAPPDDAAAFAAAVARLADDAALASRLIDNASAFVATQDWSAILPQWRELFVSLAQSRSCSANTSAMNV